MKVANTVLFVGLLSIAFYIAYKLIVVEELSRMDNYLFIVFIAGTFLLGAIRYRLKKKRSEIK
jgi:hypothetical protein